MGRINRETIEEVRAAANIVDVVGSYVSLRKRGKNYQGLCPFHGEKDPSFTVSDEKQIFHCFGCGASGSVFDFLMRTRNIGFAEAVKELANRFGIALPQARETEQAKRTRELAERLRQVNELAAGYYNRTLLDKNAGEIAREYLRGRGLGQEAIEDFQLGYAPKSWDGLKRFLLGKKVGMNIAVQAGLLVKKSEQDGYDRFRHRLMFPIKDMSGRTIGFGGRALDDSLPKYLNSPETPIFHKGRTLYGLATAREACRQNKQALVVEGYFDLLAIYNQGIRQVVAPLGTALTRQHVRLLSRLAPQAVLVFDGDEAGMQAAMRSLELFMRERMEVRLLDLPEGMDPDDFLAKKGREAFEQLLKEVRPLMEVFLDQSLADYDGTVEGRLKVIRTVTPMLRLVDSRVTQEGYLRMLDQRLGVSEEVLRAEFDLGKRGSPAGSTGRKVVQEQRIPVWEEEILRILVHYPNWIPVLEESSALDDFQGKTWLEIGRLLTKHYQEGGNLDLSGLLMDLQGDQLRNLISAWAMEVSPWREEVAHARLREYLEGVTSRRRRLEDDLKRLKEEIQAAERSQNVTLMAELLAELQAKKIALLAGKANNEANLSEGEMV
ncbi:MAG: DNA primase [Deltaproteobacteria bacterium]|nr:DNA primase [Deltaproteobacteria bacterium]